MTKVIMVSAALLASALYAQPAAGRNAEQMLSRIQAELGLSDRQTKQWGEIHERYIKEHMQLRVTQNEEIKAMLTEEQRKKFEWMQQRFRERLNKRMGGAQ